MRLHLRIAVVFALLLSGSVLLFAQRQTRTVFVNALDATGAPVLNLTAADFDVREGDAKRTVSYAGLVNGPMRIILLIDNGSTAEPYAGQMRAALNGFIDAIPEKHEIGIVSMGRSTRVRQAPTTDRAKVKDAANKFAADNGGIVFFDSLKEVDSRFQKQQGVHWPVYVMFITDGNESSANVISDEFNALTKDIFSRGTTIHAAIVQKVGPTPAVDIVTSYVNSSGGMLQEVKVPAQFPDQMKAIGARVAADAEKMSAKYQVEFASDAKYTGGVDVKIVKDGVRGQISLRRPF